MSNIEFADFLKIDIRSGTILEVSEFPEARNPAYKLKIDFGFEIGIKKTSAQITNYNSADLIGKQVSAIVNLPPKQIGNFMSEVLVLGYHDEENNVWLVTPDKNVVNGSKLS